jgi:DMSO/TMAO reductase YedYZ heme-binding membrane subunit
MAIRPLADLFPKIGILSKLVTLRKAFWILSASIIVSNFVWSSIFNINKFLTYFTLAGWALYMPLITKLSEISALILLLTSNKLSQRTLWTYWKKIQRLSYIYFITWWIVAW